MGGKDDHPAISRPGQRGIEPVEPRLAEPAGMDVPGGLVERVETDQAIAGQVDMMLDMARLHPLGLGKGRKEWRAPVVIAQHERDRQGAGVERHAQARVFLRCGVMGEIAAQHHPRRVRMIVERMGQPLHEPRDRIDSDDRLAFGHEVDIGEDDDFLHGAACDREHMSQNGRIHADAKALT